jgi:hypothetical protein
VNPALYRRLYVTPGIVDVKHVDSAVIRNDYVNTVDATDGIVTSIRTLDFQGLTIHTALGYDDVTGLGTREGRAFLGGL